MNIDMALATLAASPEGPNLCYLSPTQQMALRALLDYVKAVRTVPTSYNQHEEMDNWDQLFLDYREGISDA